MSDNNKTAKERYRQKIKRVAISKPIYVKAQKHCIEADEKPNKLIESAFDTLYQDSGEKVEGFRRIEKFAEQNNMTLDEALDILVLPLLDEDGSIEEKFRKQRLYDNELWEP